MDETGKMSHKEIARLLRGRIPAGEEAPELARFLSDFDATYPEPSVDHCEAAHLSAIFAAAQQLAEPETPVAVLAGGTPKSAPRAPRLGDEKRSWTARRFPKWAGVKLAIPVAIMLLAFGGVAFADEFVYHEASGAAGSTESTQPRTVGTVFEATGRDDGRGPASSMGGQSGVNDAGEAAVGQEDQNGQNYQNHQTDQKGQNYQNDQTDSDDTAVDQKDRNDQSDANDTAIGQKGQNDQSDANDEVIGQKGQKDQSDANDAVIGQNDQHDQHVNEDQGDRGSPAATKRTETSR